MDRAVIVVGPSRVEGVREALVGIEHRGGELLVGAHDVVRHIVAVRPRDGRADRGGGRRRRETEIVDDDILRRAGELELMDEYLANLKASDARRAERA